TGSVGEWAGVGRLRTSCTSAAPATPTTTNTQPPPTTAAGTYTAPPHPPKPPSGSTTTAAPPSLPSTTTAPSTGQPHTRNRVTHDPDVRRAVDAVRQTTPNYLLTALGAQGLLDAMLKRIEDRLGG